MSIGPSRYREVVLTSWDHGMSDLDYKGQMIWTYALRINFAAPQPSRINIDRISQLCRSPYVTPGKWLLIMMNTTGTAMNVFCLDRNLACAARRSSGLLPAFSAAIMRFCAGKIRIHTLAAIIVPNIAPM